MKLLNFGGATAILEHEGVRMLFDPWLDDGIFHGAWYHYPPATATPEDVGHVDYIYISHIHEDHCSAGTIKHLNIDAEVILMDRKPNFVARFLEANGFRFRKVHLIKPREERQLRPGLIAGLLEADPANEMAHVVDSALLLRWGGMTIYNANDCQPYEDGIQFIKQNYGRVDLALLPYSGGSGYPSCYANLTDDMKLAEKRRILASRIDNFTRTVRMLDPRWVVPFADQYVVAGSRSHLNRFISHPPCPGVVEDRLNAEGLADKLILLNSGQTYDFERQERIPDQPYRFYTEDDRARYVEQSLRDKPYDHERFAFSPGISVERLVEYARSRLWTAQQRKNYVSPTSIYLDASDIGRRFRIRLDQEHSAEVSWDEPLAQPYLRVSCGYTLLVMLLLGHASWNIADAALFLDYERMPNVYEPEVYVCLNLLKV